ncbi:MAG: DUF1080 domain-containing protein [Flavobacterium sp.]|nr:DUF1080 domain-containing protein [Pedobacter sp.]
MKNKIFATFAVIFACSVAVKAQEPKPADTEVWTPVPIEITPGKTSFDAPSDALILFNGKNLDQWVSVKDPNAAANWTVSGNILTVNKSAGNIQTKKSFGNYQLHLEWKIPENIKEEGQAKGNSGLFLASIGPGDDGYELQILDSYKNKTYVNGQAASIYKQSAPLVNANKKPGEWQTYDVVWEAPVFSTDGTLKTPAFVTVLHNGILVQNHTELKGPTQYIGQPSYKKAHGPSPIKLQAHGDPSAPISFRNIWIREIK